MKFSDYSVVVQAALMAQGNAIGWLSVVSTLLANGLLVPSYPVVVPTGRRCDLVTYANVQGEVLQAVCDWIRQQYRADIDKINARHPSLDIVI